MFDNLFYIFSKDNAIINNYISETESIREVKKLKQELHKKDAELKILQRRYNKLLNNCIEIELNRKVTKKVTKKINIIDANQDKPRIDTVSTHSDNDSIDEYEKI